MRLVVIAFLITLILGFVLLYRGFTVETTTDRTNDWPRFYRETVSKYFELPPSIKLIKAEYTATPIMGERFDVQFKLPTDRTPAAWLRQIAQDSGFRHGFHKGRFTYDCGDQCDLLRLEYHPNNDIFEANGGWD